VQLLVGGTGRTQGELLDAIARERGMRVAVDEARQDAATARIELFDVLRERLEVCHPTDAVDAAAGAEDERIRDDHDRAEISAA
jgi:hypothetical protein